MPRMTQIIDVLRKRRSELNGLERRSDEMLKQVIDKFYIVEGLNRLQTELDCLDVLIKSNTNNQNTCKDLSKLSDFEIETSTTTANIKPSNSKLTILKSFYKRSRKATRSAFSLLKVNLRRDDETSDTDISTEQLSKITRLQRNKVSELMKIVKSTIVTNYGVLEQLQLLIEMHDKNMALWDKLRQLAESILPSTANENNIENNQVEEVEEEILQKQEVYEQITNQVVEQINIEKLCCEIVKDMMVVDEQKRQHNDDDDDIDDVDDHVNSTKSDHKEDGICGGVSVKASQNDVVYERNNATTSSNDFVIGDGQSIMNPNAMTQTFVDSKAKQSSETPCNEAEIDLNKTVNSIKES